MKIHPRLGSGWTSLVTAVLIAAVACPALGQQVSQSNRSRRLADWVMTTISPDLRVEETVSDHDIVELTAVDPDFDFAKDIRFRRDVWGLEFSFKPLRVIWVDLPRSDGTMRRQLIWYMVYSVTNRGQTLHPVQQPNGTFAVETIEQPVRFLPKFVLKDHDSQNEYPDRVIPLALDAIILREDPGPDRMADPSMDFFNSVTIGSEEIAVGETRWGIVTWENVHPRIHYCSVYVRGLTNAYRWQDTPGAYAPGADPIAKGRKFARKTLKLNFWRPGDEDIENEIRFGIPGQVDYEWVYR